METLNELIRLDHSVYFLEFSSKEEYLIKRAKWRELYKWLSQTIRHNKRSEKTFERTASIIQGRMLRSGKNFWSVDHQREYYERLKRMRSNIPRFLSTHGIDATDLLKVRKEMKRLSSERRGK